MNEEEKESGHHEIITDCPGCGTPVTTANAGGYRNYCQRCVDVMPEIPGGFDERGFCKGYYLGGRYPHFWWIEA